MVIRRKNYSGYSESMLEGANYIGAQTGDYLAENILDPLDKFGEYYDKSPIQPKKVTKIRKALKPISQLMKRKKKRLDKNK